MSALSVMPLAAVNVTNDVVSDEDVNEVLEGVEA